MINFLCKWSFALFSHLVYWVNKYLQANVTGKPHICLSHPYYIGSQHLCFIFDQLILLLYNNSLQNEDFRRATRENLTNILQQQQQNPPPQPMTNIQYLPGGGTNSVAPPNIPPQYIQQQQQQRMIFVSDPRWILIIFGTF